MPVMELTGTAQTLDTAFKAVQTDVGSYIEVALPTALAIMGTILAISIAVGVFRKFVGKR